MNGKENTYTAGKSPTRSVGFLVLLFGSALLLLWLGAFKFTQAEAHAIYPLVKHHPLSFWLYDVASVENVSRAIGVVEIGIALSLLFSLRQPHWMRPAALGMIATFAATLSFLFTTPGTWRIVEHVPVTDFFILKDILFLGFGILLWEHSRIPFQRISQ